MVFAVYQVSHDLGSCGVCPNHNGIPSAMGAHDIGLSNPGPATPNGNLPCWWGIDRHSQVTVRPFDNDKGLYGAKGSRLDIK